MTDWIRCSDRMPMGEGDEIDDEPVNETLDVPELALSNPGIDLELLREYEELNPFQDDVQTDSYSIEHPFSDRALAEFRRSAASRGKMPIIVDITTC